MRCGLFGKLPAKRDFIAVNTPQAFLQVWEPWLQGSLSASRETLGQGWREAFLQAPIWRFWLGPAAAGTATLGALMPSLDGVGRYFPLAVVLRADPGRTFASPLAEPNEDWFGAVEEFLLGTLEADTPYDVTLAALEALEAPADAEDAPSAAGVRAITGGRLASAEEGGAPADALAALGPARAADAERRATIWWTLGGEGYAPRALDVAGLPDPYLFAGMLTGAVADGPATRSRETA